MNPKPTHTPWLIETPVKPRTDFSSALWYPLLNVQNDSTKKMPAAYVYEAEDAAFIVEAVNAHEELLEAVKDLLHQIETNGERSEFVTGKAIEAIAKAEGRG